MHKAARQMQNAAHLRQMPGHTYLGMQCDDAGSPTVIIGGDSLAGHNIPLGASRRVWRQACEAGNLDHCDSEQQCSSSRIDRRMGAVQRLESPPDMDWNWRI